MAKVVKSAERERLHAFFAQTVFPIVAIAVDARHAALVCLSARFAVLDSYVLSVRGSAGSGKRMTRILHDLKSVVGTRVPTTLVLERGQDARLDARALAILEQAQALAHDAGMRVHRMSIAEASRRLVIDKSPTLRNAAANLVARYSALRTCLAPGGKLRLRDHDRWRRYRSFVVAFCLAHAFGLEAVTNAARPFATRRPPPSSLI